PGRAGQGAGRRGGAGRFPGQGREPAGTARARHSQSHYQRPHGVGGDEPDRNDRRSGRGARQPVRHHQPPGAGVAARHPLRRRADGGGAQHADRGAPGRRRAAPRAHQRQPGRRCKGIERAGRHATGPAGHPAGHEIGGRVARRPGNYLIAMVFVSYTPRPGSQQSVFDMGRLADLKRGAASRPDDAGAQKQVATQVEALFLQMMLKRMREATPKGGLFDSQQSQMLRTMTDEQLALQLADPGVGLAQAMLKQMQQGRTAGADAALDPALAAAPADGSARAPRQVAALLELMRNNRARERELAVADGAPAHVVDFVSRMAGPAEHAARQTGLPARLILGQAALESGWGRRELKYENGATSHNLFGIKAGAGWRGKVVSVMTTEYQDGVPRKVVEPF